MREGYGYGFGSDCCLRIRDLFLGVKDGFIPSGIGFIPSGGQVIPDGGCVKSVGGRIFLLRNRLRYDLSSGIRVIPDGGRCIPDGGSSIPSGFLVLILCCSVILSCGFPSFLLVFREDLSASKVYCINVLLLTTP